MSPPNENCASGLCLSTNTRVYEGVCDGLVVPVRVVLCSTHKELCLTEGWTLTEDVTDGRVSRGRGP